MTRTPRKKNGQEVEFLVVADVGDRADYSTEVRHRVTVQIPFTPTKRSSTQQIRRLHDRLHRAVIEYLPEIDGDLHAWLIDRESGEPDLFVTGLLAVRESRSTKCEVEEMNRRLLPQITSEQSSTASRILVRAIAHAWGECSDEDVDGEEQEQEVLGEIFGGLDHFELVDADHSGGSVYVCAQAWHTFSLDLPFAPGDGCSAAQLRYVCSKVGDLLYQETLGEFHGVEIEEADVWLLDGSGNPSLFISGLLKVREGEETPDETENWSRMALNDLPPCFQSDSRAA